MNTERRRYFRINEMVGIAYEVADSAARPGSSDKTYAPDLLELASQQDLRIDALLKDVGAEHPKVAELMSLMNQKLERLTSYLNVEAPLLKRIASKVREANLSACGIAFSNHESFPRGTRLHLELTLYPTKDTVTTDGIVVACDEQEDGGAYCRVDFIGMKDRTQERLIQYIVQSQSAQLVSQRVEA